MVLAKIEVKAIYIHGSPGDYTGMFQPAKAAIKKKAGMSIPAFCFMENVFYITLYVRLLNAYCSSSLSTQPQSEPELTL